MRTLVILHSNIATIAARPSHQLTLPNYDHQKTDTMTKDQFTKEQWNEYNRWRDRQWLIDKTIYEYFADQHNKRAYPEHKQNPTP